MIFNTFASARQLHKVFLCSFFLILPFPSRCIKNSLWGTISRHNSVNLGCVFPSGPRTFTLLCPANPHQTLAFTDQDDSGKSETAPLEKHRHHIATVLPFFPPPLLIDKKQGFLLFLRQNHQEMHGFGTSFILMCALGTCINANVSAHVRSPQSFATLEGVVSRRL